MVFTGRSARGKALVIGLVAVIALVVGVAGGYIYFKKPPAKPKVSNIKEDTLVGKRRPDFTLKDVDDNPHSISEWDGKVIIVNFWATWCPPCRREIPAFIELQEQYEARGFTIVGVALDDKQAAIDFVDPMGINYPVLVADLDGIAISQEYGNKLGVPPFTVIVDRKGIIRHSLAREVEHEEAEKLILPLLSQN